jgi:DNA-binding transcriptional ArsR family regulator
MSLSIESRVSGRSTPLWSELQRQLHIPLRNVSIQIAVLRSAGIVETRTEGKNVYCSLAVPEIKQACHLVHCVLRSAVPRDFRFDGTGSPSAIQYRC